MQETTSESTISLKKFLETVPPGGHVSSISDLGGKKYQSSSALKSAYFSAPEILLHCDTLESCEGPRLFISQKDLQLPRTGTLKFVTYTCKNCSKTTKTFALWMKLDTDLTSGMAFKYGEFPQFGPPTPPRLTTLIRDEKELFLKGRRAENQGMGIAAFAYYRRVVDSQRERIFDEIIRVCNGLSADPEVIEELVEAKKETQFARAIKTVKHALPEALLINGQNPLTLLYDALSDGLHGHTDEECLELAMDIRVVMAEFAERMGQTMKDEAELTTSVSRLLKKKNKQASTPPPTIDQENKTQNN